MAFFLPAAPLCITACHLYPLNRAAIINLSIHPSTRPSLISMSTTMSYMLHYPIPLTQRFLPVIFWFVHTHYDVLTRSCEWCWLIIRVCYILRHIRTFIMHHMIVHHSIPFDLFIMMRRFAVMLPVILHPTCTYAYVYASYYY